MDAQERERFSEVIIVANPFQGLKRLEIQPHSRISLVIIVANPFQGLKRV